MQSGETVRGPWARAGLQVCGLAPGGPLGGWLMEGFLELSWGWGGHIPGNMCSVHGDGQGLALNMCDGV